MLSMNGHCFLHSWMKVAKTKTQWNWKMILFLEELTKEDGLCKILAEWMLRAKMGRWKNMLCGMWEILLIPMATLYDNLEMSSFQVGIAQQPLWSLDQRNMIFEPLYYLYFSHPYLSLFYLWRIADVYFHYVRDCLSWFLENFCYVFCLLPLLRA